MNIDALLAINPDHLSRLQNQNVYCKLINAELTSTQLGVYFARDKIELRDLERMRTGHPWRRFPTALSALL